MNECPGDKFLFEKQYPRRKKREEEDGKEEEKEEEEALVELLFKIGQISLPRSVSWLTLSPSLYRLPCCIERFHEILIF